MKRIALCHGDVKKVEPYADALRFAGLEPVLVSPARALDSLADMQGLLLSGGSDVDPAVYGQKPDPRNDVSDHVRDALEQRLLREALDADLPVIAICRGMQLFNVTHPGGTLVQHMEGHRLANRGTHVAEIFRETRLARIFGAGPHAVNSRHHQAVAQPGQGLVIAAKSADGVIEGLERPDRRFAIAVQWHPEDQMPEQKRLFEAYRDAV
jgi:gamma-glutamyl-gamma-aminobutyrate hydrolase PuuD